MPQNAEQPEAPAALVLLEEAVHLLRQAPKELLAAYCIGVLPFLLGLLYFWTDMSRSAFAASRLPAQALLLAGLFVWMKCWQCVFAQGLLAMLSARPEDGQARAPRPWRWRDIAPLAIRQSAIQGPGLLVLAVATLAVAPLPWAYAFYQSFTLLGHGRDNDTLRQSLHAAWQQSCLWPRQNILAQIIVLALGIFVFINLIFCLLVPAYLLKTYLATETVFSRGGFSALNSTFLLATAALAFLCLDPLLKAFYVLRCFYGYSLQTGEDLLADLGPVASPRRKLPAALLLAAVLLWPGGAQAAPPANAQSHVPTPGVESPAGDPPPVLSPQAFDRSISHVMSRREYAWRLPREQAPAEESSLARYLKGVLDDFWDWLAKLWPAEEHKATGHAGRSGSGAAWIELTRILLCALLVVLVVLIAVFIVMECKRRRRAHPASAALAPAAALPDLASENVTASDRSEAGWMELARQMMSQGDRRLALRAMFLACMALLGERGLILIRRFKSNREYLQELSRRKHVALDLSEVFGQNALIFDGVWYGQHEPTDDLIEGFARNQERIRSIANS